MATAIRAVLRFGALVVAAAVLAAGPASPIGRADDKKDDKKKADDPKLDPGGVKVKPGDKKKDDKKPADGAKDDDSLKEELLKLNRVTGEDAQKARLVEFVKDKPRAKKGVALAVKMMKAAPEKDKPLNFNACILLAKAGHFLKEYDAAEYLYDYCLESSTKIGSGSKMLQAYEGLIDLYWDARKYESVVEICEKFVDTKGPKEFADAAPFALERMIQAKAKLGQFADALRMTESLIQLDDGGWYFLQLKGWVLREQGKTDAAIDVYLEVLDKLDEAKRLKEDLRDRLKDRVRYTLTGLYVDAKKIDTAAKYLKLLIKRDPDNPTYKNDLGFIWCDNDMNLDESEKLIREALDLDKKRQEKAKAEGNLDEVRPTAAYVDSLGWVLYKKKQYDEALKHLLEASKDEEEGNHLEIWDHLGDCYSAMGKKKEAVAAWEKGLKMEDVSPRDAERRRKVTAKLTKARADLKGGDESKK